MYHIGIDIAKKFNYLGIFDQRNTLVEKHLKFDNSTDGFDQLYLFLKTHNIKKSNCIIFMESTGHYHLNLFHNLHANGFKVSVINPILTKGVSNAVAKGNKNDKVDCLKIVIAAQLNGIHITQPVEDNNSQLRTLTRQRSFLVKHNSAFKRNLISQLDQCFPEYLGEFFTGFENKTAFALLEYYQTAADFAKANVSTLTNRMKKSSRGRYGESKAKALIQLAKKSIAKNKCTKNDSLVIKMNFLTIQNNNLIIKTLENEISESAILKDSKLTTIPGVGETIAATIISETGDIEKFDNAEKFISYCGLDVLDNESGNKRGKRRLSKKGNTQIRTAIFIAAQVCSTKNLDPYFSRLLFEYKKRMSHTEAVIVLSRKMLRIAFSMMKNNTPYISPDAK